MIDIKEFLANKEIPDPYPTYRKELSRAYEKPLAHTVKMLLSKNASADKLSLDPSTAELGLLLINAPVKNIPSETIDGFYGMFHNGHTVPMGYDEKRYMRTWELLNEKGWDDPSRFQLLLYFFGETKAAYVRDAWNKIPQEMYQTGHARRSFRAPNNLHICFTNQINFLIQAIPQARSWVYKGNGYIDVYYDFSLAEQVKYHFAARLTDAAALHRIWAAALDAGDENLEKTFEAIIYNQNDAGKVTHNIPRALLSSNRQSAWELVEKLLLSAQRQEGLRQAVLEALDETSIGALKYMIKVLLKNKLTRFSSVVRAIDVWAGLGWESAKEFAVRKFLEKADYYLSHPDEIPAAMSLKDNSDVYMALWAQGVYDVEKTAPLLEQLIKNEDASKRCLAMLFAFQTNMHKLRFQTILPEFSDKNETVSAFASQYLERVINDIGTAYFNRQFPDFFCAVEKRYLTINYKEKILDGVVFSWNKSTFTRRDLLTVLILLVGDDQQRLMAVLGYLDEMNAPQRHRLSEIILPQHCEAKFAYWRKTIQVANKPLTQLQREYALKILGDRTEFSVACAALADSPLSAEEAAIIPPLLKRKSSDFRKAILALILQQQENVIKNIVEELQTGNQEQVQAASEIMLQLKKSGKIQSTPPGAEQGYGLYDPSTLPPIVKPVIDKNSYYEKCLAQHPYGFSLPLKNIKAAMQELNNLLQQYADYEYEVETWDNAKTTVLLANEFKSKKARPYLLSPSEQYESYPLPEVWKEWYEKNNLQPCDLFLITSVVQLNRKDTYNQMEGLRKLCAAVFPEMKNIYPCENATRDTQLYNIISVLRLVIPFARINTFCAGATNRLYASLDQKILQWKPSEAQRSFYAFRGWQNLIPLRFFLDSINLQQIEDGEITDIWNLYHWRQFSGLKENIAAHVPPLEVFARAYEAGLIAEDQLIRGMLTAENIRVLSHRKSQHPLIKKYPFLVPLAKSTFDKILDIELKRGDLPTPVTQFAQHIHTIYGAERFTEILAALGKTTLHKGYYYVYGNAIANKKELLSHLLQNCYPQSSDTQQTFTDAVNKYKIGEKQLLEAAMYAPQWQKFVSEYIGWKGLSEAVWWFHAHTKTAEYKVLNADIESEIARFSSIDLEDFQMGAVDIEWFKSAYKTIGKQRWAALYGAAKYITDGNGHRRARIYADVLLGQIKIKEVTAKIAKTRDQEFVRVYGLVPLSKTNPQKDMLNRYGFLQQFRKESKQFGAQKQSSENAAYRVAMDNLARNAGYVDPQRFGWAMETRQVQQILNNETSIQFGADLIKLVIDEEGRAEVLSWKDGKPLKTIPPKYKKDKKVLELLAFRKTLRAQFSRSRKSLEEAMVRGDQFTLSELQTLFGHPVISGHLKNLVFVALREGNISASGFFRDGALRTPAGLEYSLQEDEMLRIAHCTDLRQTQQWSDYQHHLFQENIRQPFKQIFRELYLPTDDELAEKSLSRRYAGHQVQPQKTAALLKTRGWKIDHEEGLQKVFHREGFLVALYAMADWFSPADVEPPTLETLRFHDLKTYEPIAFENINKRIFSEVMRDVDLAVSVAHAGSVDPECSHSTIEMRQALLGESLRLFKINNVEITGNHAIVQGKLGKYSIHLGSAIVHQMGQGYLSILPIHSQHRGRIFLPFADDDPKSAELISKVLLLANDHKIQDPTILRQVAAQL